MNLLRRTPPPSVLIQTTLDEETFYRIVDAVSTAVLRALAVGGPEGIVDRPGAAARAAGSVPPYPFTPAEVARVAQQLLFDGATLVELRQRILPSLTP